MYTPTRNFVFCRRDVKTFLQLSCLCVFNHCVITVTTTIAITTITIIVLTTITVMITATLIVIIFLSLDFFFQSARSAAFVSQSFAFPLPCFVFPNMFLIFTFNPISIKKKIQLNAALLSVTPALFRHPSTPFLPAEVIRASD